MPFKINISDKEKTFKLEADTEFLIGKKIGEKIDGKEVKSELEGYELEIMGTSDKAGFPGMKEVEGSGLKKVLLTKGFSMKNKRKGLRKRKTVRGNAISKNTIQINMKVIKQGSKKLEEIFPKEKKPEETKTEESAEEKAKKQEKKVEEEKPKTEEKTPELTEKESKKEEKTEEVEKENKEEAK